MDPQQLISAPVDYAKIDDFLDELGMDRTWAEGYLSGLLSGPELIPVNVWINEFVDDETFANIDAANEGLQTLMSFYNDVNTRLRDSIDSLVPDQDDVEACVDFCSGYVAGANLHASWKRDEAAYLLVFVFAIIADEVGEDLLRDANDQVIEDPEAWRAKHRANLLEYVTDLRDYWKERRVPTRRTEAKVGRNDPCPCGSGKKYKKCCGQ